MILLKPLLVFFIIYNCFSTGKTESKQIKNFLLYFWDGLKKWDF